MTSTAFLNILLCNVPSYSTNLPIIFKVLRLFKCDIFLIPNSISVASFAPYIGDLNIALIALLFEMLYFSYNSFSSLSGVFIKPYCTYACMAPMIKFLLMSGVIPPPLSIKGTSYVFEYSLTQLFNNMLSVC